MVVFERKLAENPELGAALLPLPTSHSTASEEETAYSAIGVGLLMLAAGSALASFSLWKLIVNSQNLPWFADKGESLSAVLLFSWIGLCLAGGGVGILHLCRKPWT